jgi:hypothetical protein
MIELPVEANLAATNKAGRARGLLGLDGVLFP